MNWWAKQKQNGFTLVELLIVIVVIAILASISAVAYNGVVQRSYTAQVASVVDGYEKLLNMYKVDNGDFPTFSDTGGSFACLTGNNTLPAVDAFAVNECDSEYADRISPELNGKLLEYTKQLPDGVFPTVEYEPGYFTRAISYGNYGGTWTFYYALNGDYDCPRGNKTSWRPGTYQCVYRLDQAAPEVD